MHLIFTATVYIHVADQIHASKGVHLCSCATKQKPEWSTFPGMPSLMS